MTQLSLLDAQPTRRRIKPVDPHLTPEEKPRLSAQCERVLDRLRRGPATNNELFAIAKRFGARIGDLRAAKYEIETRHVDHHTGLVMYTLISEPQP